MTPVYKLLANILLLELIIRIFYLERCLYEFFGKQIIYIKGGPLILSNSRNSLLI